MNEMDELSRFRAEIPDRGTAGAEEIFRAALTEELHQNDVWYHLPGTGSASCGQSGGSS